MTRPIPQFIQHWRSEWASRAGEERTLRVRWLLNPDCEPLPNIQLTEQHGVVVDLRPLADSESSDVLPVAITPPLVNAHTHLEFSGLIEPLQPPEPFQDWIRAVMQWRHTAGSDAVASIRKGLTECRNAGVRLIGEISTDDNSLAVARRSVDGVNSMLSMPFPSVADDEKPQRTEQKECGTSHAELADIWAPELTVVSFRESIGLRPDRIQQQISFAERHLTATPQAGFIRGLSPHAPYTVHPELLSELTALAVKHQAPVAMHVAETLDEMELLSAGSGRFASFLSSLGLFDTQTFPGGRSVLEFLQELATVPNALAIHGNYFSDHDIEFLAAHPNITTVYCPRTHAYFGHTRHPFRKILAAGARVILGTDSRASNPDLSIWRELQHVAHHAPELSIGQLIAMITTSAAEAMGFPSAGFVIRKGGVFDVTMLSFEQSLSNIDDIVRHAATMPLHEVK